MPLIAIVCRFVGLCFLLLSLSSGIAFSETQIEPSLHKGAVLIGAYVNGIHSIDLRAGTVDLDLYIWLRTKSERNLLDSIEVVNGSIIEKSAVVKKKIGDENYFSMRISAKAFQIFDLRKFPLDKQNLAIVFEDSEEDISALQFVPDEMNTKVASAAELPGWKIGKAAINISSHSYDTNYGDLSLGQNNSKFSRAAISIPIDREGVGYFFKLFGTVFLSAFVTFLSFFIRPNNLDPRFGLGVGGIFAVVASNFVLSSMLPDTNQVTMGEALLLLTIISIFIALTESVISLRLWESDKEEMAIKLDSMAGWIMPIVYLAMCALILIGYGVTVSTAGVGRLL
jgi:hypothetical protein